MTTYKYGAHNIQALIMNYSKIDACAPLLKILLSQCPLSINFHMQKTYDGRLVLKDYPTWRFWFEGTGLFSDTLKGKRFWHDNTITFEQYIFDGFNYSNVSKFEFSAEQQEILTKLNVIAQDYLREEKEIQQKLCSKYIEPSLLLTPH